MRCHICNGFTNDRCRVCGNYTCSLCMEDGICKRCNADIRNTDLTFPRLESINDPLLLIVGISLIFIGFALLSFSFIDGIKDTNGSGFIFIFPFIFIEAPDLMILLPIILFFILLPLLLFILMRKQL